MLGKAIGGVVLLGIVGGILTWYGLRGVPKVNQSVHTAQPIKVVATFYPLQEIAKSVVGDLGSVTAIVPAGSEPHEFEPTAGAVRSLYDADLVIINGAGMDPWAEKLSSDLSVKGKSVIVLASAVDLLPVREGEVAETGEYNPHIWLDPNIAVGLAEQIDQTLENQFPTKADTLRKNTESTVAQLKTLDAEYRMGLKKCRLHEVVTSHNAFGYLAKQYGFTTHALSGISPEEEPSPRKLATLAQLVKEQSIRYIFFETLVSPKLAETLAQETGAETLIFDPIEGVRPEDAAQGVNYFSLMRSNLKALQKALECN